MEAHHLEKLSVNDVRDAAMRSRPGGRHEDYSFKVHWTTLSLKISAGLSEKQCLTTQLAHVIQLQHGSSGRRQ